MTYYWRVFLWENGHKSTEYTEYTVAPIFIEDKLDETLDSGEVILKSMPAASRSAFPPKTKFRIERYETADYTGEPKKWDFIVEHDDVEEYVGCPEICTHRISLIEVSAVAQGMHVDNIALTYELQDVDLNYRVVIPDNSIIGDTCAKTNGNNNSYAVNHIIIDGGDVGYGGSYVMTKLTGNFENSYIYEWDNNSLDGTDGVKNIPLTHYAVNSKEVTFKIPKLYIYGINEDGMGKFALFQLNTVTRVYKVKTLNGAQISKTAIPLNSNGDTTIYSGARSFVSRNDDYAYSEGSSAYLRKLKEWASVSSSGWLGIGVNEGDSVATTKYSAIYEKFSQVASANPSFPETISFETDVLSQFELDSGYKLEYIIECKADDRYQNGMINIYRHYYYYYKNISDLGSMGGIGTSTSHSSVSQITTLEYEAAGNIKVNAAFQCIDTSEGVAIPFLKRGFEYCCYDLLRKAMLTCDTYILENGTVSLDEYGRGDVAQNSIQYPITVDPIWETRLKTATMHETIFEQKNLWEILLQIGYYLHAIPYLEFATDGTDRFVLLFKQLGDTTNNGDDNIKLTIFNSRNISDYFTQYDSYVTNLFSPQNLVEEWLTPKTSDSSYLVSNDTAELHTKYPISEIDEFGLIYNGTEYDALSFIYEQSIYEVLTGEDPEQMYPAKGNSLYYTLGDNKIKGLNYVASSVNNDRLMALKYIMERLCGVSPSVWTQRFTFNNLRFRIKYRTQDSLRLTQFRPDLEDFLKNSAYEHYPHHEQYYGQQDKIIDSERFSANLWGKLIRVGNSVYQRQEYATAGSEKISGELVTINGEPYYVTEVENEFYPDIVLQKVTYSKNFNQISQIVTIPSEPRFYEVSERSKVRREVRMQEFFTLSVTDDSEGKNPVFITADSWRDFVKELIFKKNRTLPNYAWTRFMADKLRAHSGGNSNYIDIDKLFPSNEVERTGSNSISATGSSDHTDCIVPLLHFPLHDGMVFEWDMDDNFKAGDFVDPDSAKQANNADDAYMAQQSFRYVDLFGRADLFRFKLFNKTNWTSGEIQQLPKVVLTPTGNIIGVQGSENKAVALDKDNREEISFNYQINLLHRKGADGHDFYTFPNLFGDKDEDLKVALLNRAQSLFDESVDMSWAQVLSYDVPFKFDVSPKGSLKIVFGKTQNIPWINGGSMSQVKAIAFYQNNATSGRAAFIVKNIDGLTDEDDLPTWYIYPTFTH